MGYKEGWVKRKMKGLGIPWNKGKKCLAHTEEWKRNMSELMKAKGQTPPSAKGRKRSEEFKEKVRRARIGKPRPELRGSNNILWKGGVTPINAQIRTSLEYKNWRREVFTRDDYTCLQCGSRNGHGKSIRLHADHTLPFSAYPSMRFEVSNGQTLCEDCHKETDSYLRVDFEQCPVYGLA